MEYSGNPIERARQQRAAFLASMYDLYVENGGNVYQDIWLPEAGEKVGLTEWQEMWAAASYLAEKGLIEADGGGVTGRMTVSGIDAIEHARLPIDVKGEKSTAQAASLVVNGTVVGGILFQSPNSTQTISSERTEVHQTIEHLRELLADSPLTELEKEEATLALERVGQLVLKPKSPEVIAKAKEKLELVRQIIGTAVEISAIAGPYLSMLARQFA